MPKLSIILPTYNCDGYITACLDSLLNQTFGDFELLIIDDQSTDSTVEIIKSYKDARIKLRVKEKNTGYTDSLNWGIQNAQGNYIARMDGDDICHLERFERQVDFLDTHPEIVLIGTNAQVIDSDFCFNYPSEADKMMTTLLFGNTFVHPTIMGHTEVFKKHPYDRSREPAEDYDLWTRMVSSGKVTNLPEVLLYYRVHDGQISTVKKEKQDRSARKSMFRMFQLLDYDHGVYKDELVLNAIWPHESSTLQQIKESLTWYNSLEDTNEHFAPDLLKRALSRKQYNLLKFYAQHPELIKHGKSIKSTFLKYFPVLGAKFYYKKMRS